MLNEYVVHKLFIAKDNTNTPITQSDLKTLIEILAAVYGVHKKFIQPYFEAVLKENPTYSPAFKM